MDSNTPNWKEKMKPKLLEEYLSCYEDVGQGKVSVNLLKLGYSQGYPAIINKKDMKMPYYNTQFKGYFLKFIEKRTALKLKGRNFGNDNIVGLTNLKIVTEELASPDAPLGIAGLLLIVQKGKCNITRMPFLFDPETKTFWDMTGEVINVGNIAEVSEILMEQTKKVRK